MTPRPKTGRLSRVLAGILFACAAGLAAPAMVAAEGAAEEAAKDAAGGDIAVTEAWTRATPPSAPAGGAFLTVVNRGTAPDRLLAAESPVAGRVELHTHTMDGGIMRMRPVEAIEVAPGGSAVLKPGGLHIMLMELKEPLVQGATVPLTLTFERAGSLAVSAVVRPIGARTIGD